MYPVSNAYLNEIAKNNPTTRITGTLTLKSGTSIPITNDTIAKAPSIMNQCVNNTELKLGQAYQAQCNISIYSNINRYLIYDAILALSFGLKIGNSWEDVPIGEFRVTECLRTSNDILQLTALDAMDRLDDKYSGTVITGAPFDILSLIAMNHGLELGQTQADIEALPNGTVVFGMPENYRSKTWRDVVGDLAACLAGNAMIDREGRLFIQSFATSVTRTLASSARSKEKISDYLVSYSSASCTKNGSLVSVGTDTGQDISLDDNDFLQYGLPEVTQSILTNILDAIGPLEYTPSDISWYGDPSLDLGDLIEATGGAAAASTLIPIQKFKWTWRGAHQIVAVGKNPNLGNVESLTDRKIEDAFINSGPIEDITDEQTVANIIFATVDTTTVTLWHEFKLDCALDDPDEPMQVIVHYYLNGEEESYTPVMTIGESGLHTLDYNYFLTGLSGGLRNTWTVKIECIGGSTDIAPGNIHICLAGQGLVGSDEFLGLIEVSDTMPMPFIGVDQVTVYTETINVSINTNTAEQITDNIGTLLLGGKFVDDAILDQTGEPIVAQTGEPIVAQQKAIDAAVSYPEFTESVMVTLRIADDFSAYLRANGADGMYVGEDMSNGLFNTLYQEGE